MVPNKEIQTAAIMLKVAAKLAYKCIESVGNSIKIVNL